MQNGYTKYKWSYNSAGIPMLHQDLVNNEKYLYTYDSIGRLIRYEIQSNDTSSHIGRTEFAYDIRNNLSRIYLEFGGKSVAAQYKYSAVNANDNSSAFAKDNLPTQFYINSSRHVTYNYNAINQLTRRNISTGRPINYNYTYKASDRPAEGATTYRTNLLERETIDNTTYNYTYDNIGNITKITKGERYTRDNPDSFETKNNDNYRSYEYDNLNQLTRENNKTSGKSTVFTYDGIGNITKKTEYEYSEDTLDTATKTISYRYEKDADAGWNHLLTGVDFDGNGTYSASETINYNALGNPKEYFGSNLTWYCRQLKKYVGNGNTITYTYDADGYRATKTVNGGETTYRYVNGQLVYEEKPDGRQLFYLYDAYGYLTAIRYYHGDTSTLIGYYVTTNSQGDVIGIYNAAGDLRATYEYDAWGNIISIKDGNGNTVTSDTHIAKLNSVRYRSYCYDNETGLYYVISRYYNPQVGRWLNADVAISGIGGDVLGYNVFAYCMNNPVHMSDPTGNWPKWIASAVNWVNNNIVNPVVGFVKDVKADFKNYDSNNQDEDIVFSSNFFSNYKGTFVIKTPFDASFSFGIIGLSNLQQNPDTLKHEYGHSLQLKNKGIADYTINVVVPSVTINLLDRQGKLPYDYYSYPWEAEANQLGGSKLSQTFKVKLPQDEHLSYCDLIQLFFN